MALEMSMSLDCEPRWVAFRDFPKIIINSCVCVRQDGAKTVPRQSQERPREGAKMRPRWSQKSAKMMG